MQNYRISVRGGQHYIMPKVGKTWTLLERESIRRALLEAGYFVRFVSDCRFAVSETSRSPKVEEAEVYVEKV